MITWATSKEFESTDHQAQKDFIADDPASSVLYRSRGPLLLIEPEYHILEMYISVGTVNGKKLVFF